MNIDITSALITSIMSMLNLHVERAPVMSMLNKGLQL